VKSRFRKGEEGKGRGEGGSLRFHFYCIRTFNNGLLEAGGRGGRELEGRNDFTGLLGGLSPRARAQEMENGDEEKK